jgi:hypothetical protein
MTTEFILLLGLYAFILLGVFMGENGPKATFTKSAPRLAARIEKNLSTGLNFIPKDTAGTSQWQD